MCITCHSNNGGSLQFFRHVLTRQPATFSSDTSVFPSYNAKEEEEKKRKRKEKRENNDPFHLTPESFSKTK